MQAVSRALVHLVKSAIGGWAVANLSTAAADIQNAFGKLRPNCSGCCAKCGVQMNVPTLRVYDAGQAYEVIREGSISRDLNDVLAKARECGFSLVQVLRAVRPLVAASRNLKRNYGDRVVLTVDSIKKCVDSYLMLRVFRVGNRFVQQVSGVPIGGPVSSALLRRILSSCERRFDDAWPVYAQAAQLGGTRDENIAFARYEDDVAALSHLLCSDCVDKVVQDIYGDEVAFDANTADERTDGNVIINKFLDLELRASSVSVNVDLHLANGRFAIAGDVSFMTKFRFPPPIGIRSDVCRRLAGNFMSRRARWEQIGMPLESVRLAAALDFIELRRLGYSWPVITAAWHMSQGKDSGFLPGLDVLRRVSSLPVPSSRVRELDQHTKDFLAHLYMIDTSLLDYLSE